MVFSGHAGHHSWIFRGQRRNALHDIFRRAGSFLSEPTGGGRARSGHSLGICGPGGPTHDLVLNGPQNSVLSA